MVKISVYVRGYYKEGIDDPSVIGAKLSSDPLKALERLTDDEVLGRMSKIRFVVTLDLPGTNAGCKLGALEPRTITICEYRYYEKAQAFAARLEHQMRHIQYSSKSQ